MLPMSDELNGRSNSLLAELISVVLDVDDDDRDIIRVVIAVTNESAIPISNIDSTIDTIGQGSYSPERSVSTIGPGLTRNFHFVLGEDLGHWVFNLSHGTGIKKDTIEIGPIRADLRIGDTISIEKGGEIIPKITGVNIYKRSNISKSVKFITHCPSCNSPISKIKNEPGDRT